MPSSQQGSRSLFADPNITGTNSLKTGLLLLLEKQDESVEATPTTANSAELSVFNVAVEAMPSNYSAPVMTSNSAYAYNRTGINNKLILPIDHSDINITATDSSSRLDQDENRTNPNYTIAFDNETLIAHDMIKRAMTLFTSINSSVNISSKAVGWIHSSARETGIFSANSNVSSSTNALISSEESSYILLERTKQQSSTPLDTFNLPKAKGIAQDLLSLIYHRYEIDGVGAFFWRTAQNIPDYGWDIMKYKFATKALEGKQNFLMAFGGSSVTAGHDNHYRQSYPLIVRKRLVSLFAAMGVKLVVHNIAMGANPCSPYDLCYESMGGNDPDWIGWEQSYNCGHDEGAFEMTARWAGWSKNKGIIYFSASGAWAPDKCNKNNVSKTGSTVPFSDENWKESDAKLSKKIFSAIEVHAERDLLHKYNKAHSSASRFMGSWAKGYNGIAPHGFNVWENNPQNECIKSEKKRKDCTAIDAAESMRGDCKMKFMTKEASIYGLGGGRAHHPTAAFHMLRGEAISWLHGMAMLDAIYQMEEDLKTISREKLLSVYNQKLAALQTPMPPPRKCHQYHCDSKPMCYTNYMPHFNEKYLLSDIVVGVTNWSYAGGGNSKGVGIVPNETALDAIEWQENKVPGSDVTDRKPKWTGKGPNAGEIHFKISIKQKDFIWIFAEAIVKAPFEQAVFFLDMNATTALTRSVKNETFYTPTSTRIIWTKVNKMGNEGVHLFDLPRGEHIVSILNNHTKKSKKDSACGLSHVIMW